MVSEITRNGERDASQPGEPWSPHWAVVLAGGNGTRLRAFVRQVLGSDRPKQFCRIIGTRSMLRHTWDRAVRVVAPQRVLFAPLRALAACLDTKAEAAALATTYHRLPSVDLSRAMLARRPELLAVLAARDICWSDWGELDSILQTLRRFDLRPRWLAASHGAQMSARAKAGGGAYDDALRGTKETPPGPGEVNVAEPTSPITAAGHGGKGVAQWGGNYGDDGEGGSRVRETAARRR